MSNEVKLKARIQNKYETLENWNKLIKGDFIPLKGEVCYAVDNNKLYQKVGDGETDFLDLPWLLNQGDWNEENELSPEYIKNKPMKIITEPTHIGELDVGIYLVNGNSGKVIIENINDQGKVEEDYCYIESGTLSVLYKIMEEENGALSGTIIYNASGIIISKSYTAQDEVGTDENGIIIHHQPLAVDNPSAINLGTVSVFKILDASQIAGGDEDLNINTWYGCNSSFKFSDIPATAIETDLNYSTTRTTIPTSSAVKNYIKEQSPIKEITTTVHVADLEPGMYYVNEGLILPGSEARVILANINQKDVIDDNYAYLSGGYIIVTGSYEDTESESGIVYKYLSYTAHGFISLPNYFNDDGWLQLSHTTSGSSELHCMLGYAMKILDENLLSEANIDNAETNKWYSNLDFLVRSNITTSNLSNYFQQGGIYEVPTTQGVYNFAMNNQADYKEWEEDRPSFIKNKPFYAEYTPQGENKVLINTGYYYDGTTNTGDTLDTDYLPSINDKFNIRGTYTLELEDAPWYDMEYRKLSCIYDDNLQGYIIGNAHLYNTKYEDTKELICITVYYNADKNLQYDTYAWYHHGDFILELLPPEEEVIHHIDQKYLPYYSEYEEQQYILEPVTLDCQEAETDEGYTLYVNSGETESVPREEFLSLIIEGQKYKINYDGKYYICEAYAYTDSESFIAFGNQKLIGNEEYTGDEPFALILDFDTEDDNGYFHYSLLTLDQGMHTISVEYVEKSIPIFKTDSLNFTAMEDISISRDIDLSDLYTNTWSQIAIQKIVHHKMECKVTLNGEEYISNWKTIDDSNMFFFLGNLYIMDKTIYKNTKENFLIIFYNNTIKIGSTLPAGTYDCSIELNGYPKREINVEKIPKKYLDIDVPYTTDGVATTFNTDIRFQTRGLLGDDESTMDLVLAFQRVGEEIKAQPHLRYGGEYYDNGNYYISTDARAWSTGAVPNGHYSWTEGDPDRSWLTETMYQYQARLVVEEINNPNSYSTLSNICLEVSISSVSEAQRYIDEMNNGTRQILQIEFVDDANTYLVKPKSVYPIGSYTFRIPFDFIGDNRFSVELDQNGREIESIKFLGFYGCFAHSQNSGYAMGKNSSAEGNRTVALGEDQHVQGHYNELDGEGKYAHIVGNGLGLNSRSNAYTLDWEGNGNYSGTVTAKKFIAEEEEAFGKFTDSYFVLNDIGNGLNYAIQMKNGEIISTELPVRIQVKQKPTKTNYYFGEVFDSTGMIIEAVYNDGTTKLIEDFSTNYDNKTLESTGSVQIIVKAKSPSVFTTTLSVIVAEFNDTTILQDFIYSQSNSREFELQDWKETYSGVSSTELIIPDYSVIKP